MSVIEPVAATIAAAVKPPLKHAHLTRNTWYKVESYKHWYAYSKTRQPQTGWYVQLVDLYNNTNEFEAVYHVIMTPGPGQPTKSGFLAFTDPDSRADFYSTNLKLSLVTDKELCQALDTPMQGSPLKNLRLYGRGYGKARNTGSDPELFAVDANGVVIPAWKWLPPQNKGKVSEASIFWDGFQAEFNVVPDYCHAWLTDKIHLQIRAMYKLLMAHDPTAKLVSDDVMMIPEEMMASVSKEHSQLGCAPSKSAYKEAPLEVNGRDLLVRFAGCHIHHGFDELEKPKNEDAVVKIIKGIDRIAGVMITALIGEMENPIRRQFYGKAGEYRTPSYGFEYRTPSSRILSHPVVTHCALDIIRIAAHYAGKGLAHLWEMPGEETQVQHIINNCDYKEARVVIKENLPMFEYITTALYIPYDEDSATWEQAQAVKNSRLLFSEGARQHLPVDESLVENWRITHKGVFVTDEERGRKNADKEKIWINHAGSENACVTHAKLRPSSMPHDEPTVTA